MPVNLIMGDGRSMLIGGGAINAISNRPASVRNHKLQVGPWVPAPLNTEEPFINVVNGAWLSWAGSGNTPESLLAAGHINANTGMLDSFPGGLSNGLTTAEFHTAAEKSVYDGPWVIDWDGNGTPTAEFIPLANQNLVTPNRLEFTRDGTTLNHMRIRFTSLGAGGISNLRMYRAENEALINAGQIYSPGFIANVGRADIVRTMDFQEANRAFIHRANDVCPMGFGFWNNHWENLGAASQYRSMPLQAVFALGVEANVEIWHHCPAGLGATTDFEDPSLYDPDVGGVWAPNVRTMAQANAAAILASPEWDNYADAFVAALSASGYPESRMLYSSLQNEVWNLGLHFHVSTIYADGIGRGYGHPAFAWRQGYGILLARWMMALEAAFARAGRNQAVTYVCESQAAAPNTTTEALTTMKAFVEAEGGVWTNYNSKIGVSVASYWGGHPNWEAFTATERQNPDPAFWAAVTDRIINGPSTEIVTLDWITTNFDAHIANAATFGVGFVGAYEGGSHFNRYSDVPIADYDAWHWGAGGAYINQAINDALIARYPGIILSNYATFGPPTGQAWFEGWPAPFPVTALNASWDKYYK